MLRIGGKHSPNLRLGFAGCLSDKLSQGKASPRAVAYVSNKQEFVVHFEGAQQQSGRLLVTDLQGRALVNKLLLIGQPTQFERVSLQGSRSGIYLLQVSTNQSSQIIKVLKKG